VSSVSIPQQAQPVKLIASILYGEAGIDEIALQKLQEEFAATDYVSPVLPFDFTDYYADELGSTLFRRLVSFERLISPEALPDIKLFANRLEAQLARADGTRRVNIDPGYVSLWHMVLASCKPFAHRPYLGKGVYADLTLLYRRKSFVPLAWTFPDYRSHEMITLLNAIRQRYYQQMKRESVLRSQ